MGKQKPTIQLSEAEIRAIYAEGEEAVVSFVSQWMARLNQLETEVKELPGRLSKNSRNSSKPPSGDGFGQRTRSLRPQSDQPSGGQTGHPGQTLEWCDEPDFIERHAVNVCSGCVTSLATVSVDEVMARQVFDIPPLELLVTEHQVEVKGCPNCGQSRAGDFPAAASNVVQYGPRLKGMMVYLMEGQLLPSHRSGELLSDLMGVRVSEGTLYNTREQCFEHLEAIEQKIGQAIKTTEVVHFDETGMRVNQRLWWLHVAATDALTYYFVHLKRGQAAIDEMAILPEFVGKAVHDGWQSYQRYGCEHFLCNAHHLRELQYILEHYSQGWAFQLRVLLVSIHRQVEGLKAQGQPALPRGELAAFNARYDALLEQGFEQNPMPSPDPNQPKKRERAKRSPPRNLLERLRTHKASVLGFRHDFTVPFDNNQAERDLRMMKLKQKISGCFRTEDGAQMFCRIRGYLATMRKQGHNVFNALVDLFAGKPQSPLPQAK